jgi:hypothetical protein
MLEGPNESMKHGSGVDLVTADTTQKEFDNLLKFRPHYMTLFIALADFAVQGQADRLDARGLMSMMRWFGKRLTGKKLGVGNQFSQYFAREAIKRRPDLAPFITLRPDLEKK